MQTTPERFAQLQKLIEEKQRRQGLRSPAEAFVDFFLERVLGLGREAIRGAVTHGPSDGGIDAVHVDRKGARVAGGTHLGAHVVACDHVDSLHEARRPIPNARLDRLATTWVAIASSRDRELPLNAALRQQIEALHLYWKNTETTGVPHDIYIVTNREDSGIDRSQLERRMDYYTRHAYHYYELADLVGSPAQ